MKTAIFKNITDKPFVGHWDGKKRTFLPGAQKLLPAYLAEHYALHLTNSILIEKGHITMTSPKKPEQVPLFMEIFETICIPQDTDDDEDEVEMPVVDAKKKVKTVVDDKPVQIIGSPDNDVDDEDFQGLKDDSDDKDDTNE